MMAHLWSLCRTDHAPVCVVQLPRASQFAVPPDGGVETAEMGERGCEGEAVQHLNREERGQEEGREQGRVMCGRHK